MLHLIAVTLRGFNAVLATPARWFQPPALAAFCDILVAQLDCRAAASCDPLMLTQPGPGLRFP